MRRQQMCGRISCKPRCRQIGVLPFDIDRQDRCIYGNAWPLLNLRFDVLRHHIVHQILLLLRLFVFALPISSPPLLLRVFEVQHNASEPHRISQQTQRE